MTEVGIRHRQLLKWTSRQPKCRKDVLNVSSTDIYEFAPHLLVLAIGMIIALTLLIFELAMDMYESKKPFHHPNNLHLIWSYLTFNKNLIK